MKLSSKISFILFFLFCVGVNAQSVKPVEVVFDGSKNLRQLAEEYLGDPNLWEEILFNNGLRKVDQVTKGMTLKIDAEKIINTQKAKNIAKEKIDEANKEGAKLFASSEIASAIKNYDNGLVNSKIGAWDKSIDLFNTAEKEASSALAIISEKRVVDAEAFVSFRRGRVEKRTVQERTWSDAPLQTKLFTEDRARTLSDSYAEISFSDKSKIRLNENSQAVIKKSRVDLLNKNSENSVKLEKGDAFALFSKGSKKKNEIEVPGVDVKVNSSFFWVEKNEETTKFANYDGEIQVTSNDSSITLAQNQGSIIPKGGVPSAPIELLSPPDLLSPDANSEIYRSTIEFSWEPVNEAKKYLLVISRDVKREAVVRSNKNVSDTKFTIENLEPGFYYYNVSAVDKYGFPGPFGEARGFNVIRDETKPYLVVNTPENNFFTNNSEINITGEVEPDIKVDVNGTNIEHNGKSFTKSFTLEKGYNKLTFTARDKAGNETIIIREVFYEPKGEIKLNFDSELNRNTLGEIITSQPTLALNGNTFPQSSVDLTGLNIRTKLRAYADNQGDFSFMLSNLGATNIYLVEIVTPGGNKFSDTVKVVFANVKPVINLAEQIPSKTNEQVLTLAGTVSGAGKLEINDSEVNISSGEFSYNLPLEEGSNRVTLVAINGAGSKTTLSRVVKLDSTPPQVIKDEISRLQKNGELHLAIKVFVSDESQLKKNAVARISSSSFTATKYLTLGGKNEFYIGEIPIPEHAADKKLNIDIQIEDYFGNKFNYKIIK